MIGIDWIRRRRRAVVLGDMGFSKIWADPETEEMWQARTRWQLFEVPSPTADVEEVVGMLEYHSACELYVDPDHPLSEVSDE